MKHRVQIVWVLSGLTAVTLLSGCMSSHPEPFLRRAKIHRNRGEYEASAEDFAEAVQRGMSEPWVRAEWAMVLIAAG